MTNHLDPRGQLDIIDHQQENILLKFFLAITSSINQIQYELKTMLAEQFQQKLSFRKIHQYSTIFVQALCISPVTTLVKL